MKKSDLFFGAPILKITTFSKGSIKASLSLILLLLALALPSTTVLASSKEAKLVATACVAELALLDKYAKDDEAEIETGSMAQILFGENKIIFGPEYQAAFFKVLEQNQMSLESFTHGMSSLGNTEKLKLDVARKIWHQLLADYPYNPATENDFTAAAEFAKKIEGQGVNWARYFNVSQALNEIETHPVFKKQTLDLMARSLVDYVRLLVLEKPLAMAKSVRADKIATLKKLVKEDIGLAGDIRDPFTGVLYFILAPPKIGYAKARIWLLERRGRKLDKLKAKALGE